MGFSNVVTKIDKETKKTRDAGGENESRFSKKELKKLRKKLDKKRG